MTKHAYLYSCIVINQCKVVNHCIKIFDGCYHQVENEVVTSPPGNPQDKPHMLSKEVVAM